MVKSIREFFEALKETKVRYVVLSEWQDLPFDYTGPIRILAESENAVVRMTGITKERGIQYRIDLASGAAATVEIIEKGRGFLPERFESQLLEKTHVHNDVVNAPEPTEHALSILYDMLYHSSEFTEYQKKIIGDYVNNRVGPPVKCRIRSIPFYP